MIAAERRAADLIPQQMRACWTFGMLIAQRVEAGRDALGALVAAARAEAPAVPEPLLRSVLLEELRACVTRWEMCRDQAGRSMWRALDPLLERRAPSREIVAAAHLANDRTPRPEQADPSQIHWSYTRPMLRHEVNDLVRRKVAHTMKQMQERAGA